MFSRAALAVFAVVVAEILLFGAAADIFGATAVVAVSIAALVVGVVLLRRNLSALLVDGSKIAMDPGAEGSRVGDRLLRVVGAVLLIIPGLATAVVGLALLFPPSRALVGASVRRRIVRYVPTDLGGPIFFGPRGPGGARHHDVVDVDIVREDPTTSAPPELN